MSSTVFENTNLDFNVSLIKLDRRVNGSACEDVVESITPIDNGAVISLIVEESSLSLGAKGSIIISNKFNILEGSNVITNTPNDLYVAIQIRDTDLDTVDVKEEDTYVNVVGLVNNTTTGSGNAIENTIIMEWEEAFVAATKKTQVGYFDGKGEDIGLGHIGNLDVVSLAELFNDKVYKLKSDNRITLTPSAPNVLHNIKTTSDHNPSVHSALVHMLEETTTGEAGRGTVGKVPYFRFVNAIGDEGKITRKLKFDAFLSDRHMEFVNSVATGVTTGDYSDVYTEKFMLGPLVEAAAQDPNTNLYNKVEVFNNNRADVGVLRENTWGDYHLAYFPSSQGPIVNMDPGFFNTQHKTFSDLQLEFIDRELGGADLEVNIPLLNPVEMSEFHVDVNTLSNPSSTDYSMVQQLNKIANKVNKSFLTINETIEFTSKGSVIRQPNKFIWIERGVTEEDYKKLWYVNSVTHKFVEGKYTTDVIATKIFGDTTVEAIQANQTRTLS